MRIACLRLLDLAAFAAGTALAVPRLKRRILAFHIAPHAGDICAWFFSSPWRPPKCFVHYPCPSTSRQVAINDNSLDPIRLAYLSQRLAVDPFSSRPRFQNDFSFGVALLDITLGAPASASP